MAVDVAPEILEEIEKYFEEYYKDPNVKRIYKKIVDGTATYSDMQILSRLVGDHVYQSIEKAYTNALNAGKLPNGRLYENIVDKTVRPTLKEGHGIITEACGEVQTDLNRKSGIKLNAVEPAINESKVTGLIYQITNTNETRISRTVLSGLIDTFFRSVVDDYVRANLEFQKESGLSPQISRTRGPNSNKRCAYCAALVYTGEYKDPGMPAEIFRRHRYCHCNVLYNPMNGKLQDVWAKQEYKDYREAQQKQRQYLNELDKMTPTERRLARNARARELRRAKYTPQEWERRKALEAEIAEGKGLSKALPLEERKNYGGLVIAKGNGNDIMNAGGIAGAHNPFSESAERHAKRYYEEIRKRMSDVNRIANNTGFSTEEIQRIKEYVFIEKHNLNGEIRRFDESYMISESWRRLQEGTQQPHDLILLKHELEEIRLVESGLPQDEAHIKATHKYDYDTAATEFHGLGQEYKNKR